MTGLTVTQEDIPEAFSIIPSEAARFLGVTMRKLDEMSASGELRQIQTTPKGKHRRYNLCELIAVRRARLGRNHDEDERWQETVSV